MEEMKKLEEVLKKARNERVICNGVGPLSLLGVVLVILKAVGTISISWWWATAPFWIPCAIGIAVLVVTLLLLAIVLGLAKATGASLTDLSGTTSEDVEPTESNEQSPEPAVEETPVEEACTCQETQTLKEEE